MYQYFIEISNKNNQLLHALLLFILINYITSILVMIVEKKWNRIKLGLKNIFGKIGILILIYIAQFIGVIFFDSDSLCGIVILFYLPREVIAILDNLEHLGVPLPPIMIQIIEKIIKDNTNNSTSPSS